MQRTTIMLPNELKKKAQNYAKRYGLSMGELIRDSLSQSLQKAYASRSRDSLFQWTAKTSGNAPEDLALKHDDYLYSHP